MDSSDYGRLATAAAAVCESLREAVARQIQTGAAVSEAADQFRIKGIRGFPDFCGEVLNIPHPEAMLLVRYATHRPRWADPSAVDLSDPLAGEVLELATRHAARRLGMPPDALDEPEGEVG